MFSRRIFLKYLGASVFTYILSRIGLVKAQQRVKNCSRLSSVPGLLLYLAAKDMGIPVKEGIDTVSTLVIVNRREIEGRDLLGTRDSVLLGGNATRGVVKAAEYDLIFFAEQFKLAIAATPLDNNSVLASYRLTYKKGVMTAAAIYKLEGDTVYLDKLTVNGKPKILVSCANECQDDLDCGPPDPDCLNYCCSWNINCLISCCGANNPWNPCYVPCHTSISACLLCLLIVCGIVCIQYTCCTRYHKICAGHR